VRHTSKLERSLISGGKLGNEGYDTTLSKHSWKIVKGSIVLVRDDKIGKLYLVPSASFVKGSSSLKNGDRFHECWDCKKKRRVTFSLGEEEV